MGVQPGLELVDGGGTDDRQGETVPIVYHSRAECLSPWSCLCSHFPKLPWVATSALRRVWDEELIWSEIDPTVDDLVDLNHVTPASPVE